MLKDKYQIHVTSFLFFLPLTYLFGVAVTEFFSLILIILLPFFIKKKYLLSDVNKIIIFLLLFSIYIFLNAYFQINDNLKYSSFFHFRYLILSISIYCILNEYKNYKLNNYNFFFKLICTIICIIFFDSFYQFFLGENLLGYKIINGRISSFFGSELILGSFFVKILPFFIWLILFFKLHKNIKEIYLIIFFTSFFTIVFLSGERSAFFLMIMTIFFVIGFVSSLKNIFIKSALILFFFIIISYNFNLGKSVPGPAHRILVKTFNQITNNIFTKDGKFYYPDKAKTIEDLNLKKNLKIFSSDHQGHFLLGYHLFKKNVFFGAGPKGFRYHCRKVQYDPKVGVCTTHPHNTFIQIMSELGIIGLAFYLTFFVFVIKQIFICIRNKNILNSDSGSFFLIISLGLINNVFPFLPSGNFFNNWISIINYFYIGIYMYSSRIVFK